MLVAAVGHFYAFPYKEYAGANIGGSRGLSASLAHALKLNDFYHDTVHQASLTFNILLIVLLYRHNTKHQTQWITVQPSCCNSSSMELSV